MNSNCQHTVTISTASPEQTQSAGRILGAHASAGDVFLLTGDLGAGKTCLTQGILWGLGGDEYARSPTFVLICEYHARLTLYHMDLYRLDSIDEVIDLCLDEYFLGDGVCVVEWADKGVGAYIGEHVNVVVEDTGDNTRRLTFDADSPRYSEMLGALQQEFSSSKSAAQPDPRKSQAANVEAQ